MTKKRKILRDAGTLAILSMILAGILNFAWESVYDEATEIESIVLDQVPGLESGGIQAVAMFGLGLYFTWALFFTQDGRKRIQGYFILGGSLLALLTLAAFNTFIPQMEPTLTNFVAFVVGIVVAVSTEIFETRLNDYETDLLNIDLSRSSFGQAITKNKEWAEFRASTRGLLGILASVLGGGTIVLFVSGASTITVIFTLLITLIFLWRLNVLLQYNLGESGVEILGPTGSGKTLFLYGTYLTIEDSEFLEYHNSKATWTGKVEKIEQRQKSGADPWGPDSTSKQEFEEYWIEFIDLSGYWKKVTISLSDFPGQYLSSIFEDKDTTAITDGGSTTDDEEDDSYWGRVTDDSEGKETDLTSINGIGPEEAEYLANAGIESIDDLKSMSASEVTDIFGNGELARRIKEELDVNQQQEVEDMQAEANRAAIGADEIVSRLEESLDQAEQILCLIDTKEAIDSGLLNIEEDKIRGEITNSNDGTKISVMKKICETADPEQIILVATKTDLLIPAFMNETDSKGEPHEELGDFEDFTQWINQKFDRPPFNTFQDDNVNETIYPVYYQTETQEGGDVQPALDGGVMQPEGFEQIIEEVIPE